MANRRNKRRHRAAENSPPEGDTPFTSGASHIRYSIREFEPRLVSIACNLPDADDGRDQLQELMKSAFNSKYGASMAVIETRLELLGRERERAARELEAARTSEAKTPQWQRAAEINHERNERRLREVSFSNWQTRHKVEAAVICCLLPVTLIASFITAHSNLVGTGLPVFLDNPLLPITMSMLAPMAGLSVKLFSSMFRTHHGHRLFTACLNSVTFVLVLIWVGLFAELFHGIGASDVGSGLFDETSLWDEIKNTLFVATTLLTEVGIGAVLANRLDRIAMTYSPDYWARNHESETVQQRIAALEQTIMEQTADYAQLTGERAEFTHSLQLQLNMARLAYDARRARLDGSDLS